MKDKQPFILTVLTQKKVTISATKGERRCIDGDSLVFRPIYMFLLTFRQISLHFQAFTPELRCKDSTYVLVLQTFYVKSCKY